VDGFPWVVGPSPGNSHAKEDYTVEVLDDLLSGLLVGPFFKEGRWEIARVVSPRNILHSIDGTYKK
jgi:hypothetical protein